jgi:hypothetical protein
MADSAVNFFSLPQSRNLIERLRENGVSMAAENEGDRR